MKKDPRPKIRWFEPVLETLLFPITLTLSYLVATQSFQSFVFIGLGPVTFFLLDALFSQWSSTREGERLAKLVSAIIAAPVAGFGASLTGWVGVAFAISVSAYLVVYLRRKEAEGPLIYR